MPDWFETSRCTYFQAYERHHDYVRWEKRKAVKRDYLVRAAAKKSEAVKIADRFVAGYRPLFGIAPPRGNRRSKL